MPLRLEITSYQQHRLRDSGVKEFGAKGGTIGRSNESDWVLQDGKRYVSNCHACIDFRSGSYYIVDTSRNGVYVNDDIQPVGKGKPQRLFDGDRLRIGEYEMVAHILDGGREARDLNDERHVDPVDRAQLVDNPEPTGRELIDEHEMTAVGIEDILLAETGANTSGSNPGDTSISVKLQLDDSDSCEIIVDADEAERSTAATGAAAASELPDLDVALQLLVSTLENSPEAAVLAMQKLVHELETRKDPRLTVVRMALSDLVEGYDESGLRSRIGR